MKFQNIYKAIIKQWSETTSIFSHEKTKLINNYNNAPVPVKK